MRIRVRFRDGDLRARGSLGTAAEPTWTKLSVVKRFLMVGSWSVTFPETRRNWERALLPDVGVVIERDGRVLMTGHAESLSYAWSADGDQPGMLTLSGGDDLAGVANRVAFADPSQPFSAQTAQARDDQTGALEDVVWHYLNANVGPGALAARKVPWLTLPASLSRGGIVKASARFDPLMDLIRSLQPAGGPLGVDVVQQGGALSVVMFEPRDLTGKARFSRALGNLRSVEMMSSTPTTTSALVGGSGSGTSRAMVQVDDGSANPWTYAETFVDERSTSDATELAQAGQSALVQGTVQSSLTAKTVDIPNLRYGVDYDLGDKVTVEVFPGVTFVDLVRAVQLDADADAGETLACTIGALGGDDDAGATTKLAAQVRDLTRQLARLQAGQ